MSSSTFPPLPSLPNVDPIRSPLDAFKLNTAEHVSQLLGIPLQKAFEGVESGKPGKNTKGDFSLAVARFRIPGDAKALAQKLADEFKPNAYMDSAEATGAFVTFKINTESLIRLVLEQINTLTYLTPPAAPSLASLEINDYEPKPAHLFKTGGFGTNTSGAGKKMIVEFSSPNIAKPFHAGHLRSTIIGAFLGNLYEANGWDVIRMNYLGDWGKQFGILAVGFEKYGSAEELERDAITHLYDVYVKINADGTADPVTGIAPDATVHDRAREFFVRMEGGDKEALALWGKFRDLSIVKYKQTYARLNIHFDIYSGESQVSHAGQDAAIAQLHDVGITEESKGALIVDLEKYKLGKTILRKQDGTYVYITRDIAGANERWEKFKFDKMVYVVANQQDLHLAQASLRIHFLANCCGHLLNLSNKQFFKVLELMKYPWADRIQHVNFGMVLGMSTRKGTAVFLDQILNESKDVMHEQMRKNEAKYNAVDDPVETSDKLGITAVKIQDMAAKRVNNYKFEWTRMTSFEGDTGPYLQYAHVRLSSVERKNAPTLVLPPPSERASTIDTKLLVEPAARDIVALLATYPDVVKTALVNCEPSTIVTFCFRLTHAISSAWETLIVKDQPTDVAMARLWLYVATKDVLANAMKLLTLEPLEKM
ncbi:arginyl-tRNA synthetase, partial [Phenoliferia sp. Uapishka_3]